MYTKTYITTFPNIVGLCTALVFRKMLKSRSHFLTIFHCVQCHFYSLFKWTCQIAQAMCHHLRKYLVHIFLWTFPLCPLWLLQEWLCHCVTFTHWEPHSYSFIMMTKPPLTIKLLYGFFTLRNVPSKCIHMHVKKSTIKASIKTCCIQCMVDCCINFVIQCYMWGGKNVHGYTHSVSVGHRQWDDVCQYSSIM